MNELSIIDLQFGGREHAIGVYLVDTDDGLALFDCGPASTLDALNAGWRTTASNYVTYGTSCSRTSTSTTPARRARSSAASSGPRRSGSRPIGSPHLVDPSASSARRGGCMAICSIRCGVSSRRCRATTSGSPKATSWAGSASRRAATRTITSATSATARCSRATPAGVRMPGASYVLPVSPAARHRRRGAGTRRPRRSGRARSTGWRSSTSACTRTSRAPCTGSTPSSTAGQSACATGSSQEEFVELALADAGQDAETYDRVAPFWQSWQGLRRYWDTLRALTRLGPLHEREFRLLFAGRTISMLGSAMAPIALAFAVLNTLDGTATQIGHRPRRPSGARLVLLLFGGVWADRLPRHHVLVASNVLSGASQATTAALLLSGHATLWELAVLAAVNSASSAFFFPASAGIVPQTVPASMLQSANATLRLVDQLDEHRRRGARRPARRRHEPGLGDRASTRRATGSPPSCIAADAHSRRSCARGQHRLARAPRRLARLLVANLALGDRAAVLLRDRAQAGAVNVLGPEVANAHLGGAGPFGIILAATTGGTCSQDS